MSHEGYDRGDNTEKKYLTALAGHLIFSAIIATLITRMNRQRKHFIVYIYRKQHYLIQEYR